jgi:membrane-bound lytic murein transglycosylase D
MLLLTIAVKAQNEQVYIQRLSTLKSQVEMTYNPAVKKHIDAYLANPERTRELIGLSKVYFPMIERSLRAKNIPVDMKYLAVALAELDPMVQAPSGASGMWMMPYNVSKMYKLKVNSYIDERKDPTKSTNIVATHFKDLFSIYRQWPLVIAAYTSSPVMLNKSIRMAGNSMYFWDLYQYIPEGTRDVYPKFIAAAYICNFYKEHGIKPSPAALFNETDSAMVRKWLSFQQISSTLEIPIEQLRKLNPIFKKDVIPYTLEGYLLKLPKSKAKYFNLLNDSVYKPIVSPGDFAPVVIQRIPGDTPGSASNGINKPDHTVVNRNEPTPVFDKKRVYYSVKKGDMIADVADWFDVTTREIKSWNKLKSEKLRAGQKLIIWVKQSKTGYYKRINSMSASQKKKLKRKD